MIDFFVAGIPKALSVGKTFAFNRGGKAQHVQSRRNTDWATMVGHMGREHAPPEPLLGPLAFTATFYLPVPKYLSKRPETLPVTRPDVDNLIHKLTDQFNGIFYVDDSQIVDLVVGKRYARDGRPGVRIQVATT